MCCGGSDGTCPYLNLPSVFLYLRGNIRGAVAPPLSGTELRQLWLNKRIKLQRATYKPTGATTGSAVAVQRGWWFSAHEQWKYLLLPYSDSVVNWRVFVNGERARTQHSAQQRIPGMFASVTNVTANGATPASSWQYLSAAGVQQVAFLNVTDHTVVTPYVQAIP